MITISHKKTKRIGFDKHQSFLHHIPKQYGGTCTIPLGQSNQEYELYQFIQHNNAVNDPHRPRQYNVCSSCSNIQNNSNIHQWPCPICRWSPVRSY